MGVGLLRRADLWLPPLLLMGVIFFFSAQPSLDSGLGLLDLVGRKLIHFAGFGVLCYLWWRLLRVGMNPGRAALVAFLLSSLYAVSDEYHQSHVEGRNGTPIDWAIDSAGAALVALRLRMRARREAAA
jgi:VanZ family protein